MTDKKADELIEAINRLTDCIEQIGMDGLPIYSAIDIVKDERIGTHKEIKPLYVSK